MQSDQRLDATSAARGGQVGDLLAAALRRAGADGAHKRDRAGDTGTAVRALAVLDCGGGSGRFAVPLAQQGADVTVVDISIDALATLRRRALEVGVAEHVIAVQGDVESLAESLAAAAAPQSSTAAFDLVLAHDILGVVESVPETFAAIAAAVRPGGLLSVLVGNPVAGVLARALAGDVLAAEREFAQLDAPDRLGPAVIERLCAEHGLHIEQVHGIGVFRDLVPGAAVDVPGGREILARLDVASAQRSPFAEIAGRVHLLARRPAG